MSEENAQSQEQQKPKAKVLASTPKEDATQVIVLEPKTKGREPNQWEVYPIGISEDGAKAKTWYELPCVVAKQALTPENALDLALGYTVLREKPLRPAEEGEQQPAKEHFMAIQGYRVEKPNGEFVNREIRCVVADPIMRKGDKDGPPIGYNILAVPGNKEQGVKATYATIWCSNWQRDNVTAPDGSEIKPLSLVECFEIVREGATITRDTDRGEIQIKMKGLKKDAKGFSTVEFEPWQAHIAKQQSKGQGQVAPMKRGR